MLFLDFTKPRLVVPKYLDSCAFHQVTGKRDLSLQGDVGVKTFESEVQSIWRTKIRR